MDDYYLASDMHGHYAIVHGITWKNHKYIKKIGEGAKALYFYSTEELKKYLHSVQNEMEKNGTSAIAASVKVATNFTNKSEDSNTVQNEPKANDSAHTDATAALQKAANVDSKDAGSSNRIFGKKKEQSDSNSLLSRNASNTRKGRASERDYAKASPEKKAAMLADVYDLTRLSLDASSEDAKKHSEGYLKSDIGKIAEGNGSKHTDISNIDAGEGYRGAGSHKKNVSGEAKEGSMKVRRQDGSDPHDAPSSGLNLYDDEGFEEYISSATKKLDELGSLDTKEGQEYFGQLCAEITTVMAFRTIEAHKELKTANDELEKAKADSEALHKELLEMQKKAEEEPGSISAEDIDWMREKITASMETEQRICNTMNEIMADIDDYTASMEECGEYFRIYSSSNWTEVLGVDPRFASGSSSKRR